MISLRSRLRSFSEFWVYFRSNFRSKINKIFLAIQKNFQIFKIPNLTGRTPVQFSDSVVGETLVVFRMPVIRNNGQVGKTFLEIFGGNFNFSKFREAMNASCSRCNYPKKYFFFKFREKSKNRPRFGRPMFRRRLYFCTLLECLKFFLRCWYGTGRAYSTFKIFYKKTYFQLFDFGIVFLRITFYVSVSIN